MKIGIDLRPLAVGDDSASAQWLRGAIGALLARDSTHTFVLFHTVFNYHLFPELPPGVQRRTLSAPGYLTELQDILHFEGDFDLLLRTEAESVLDRFPLERQLICVWDWAHEAPGAFDPEALRAKRRTLRAYQTRGAGLAVPDEATRRAVLADSWTTGDVFVAPAGEPGAEALRDAFDRARPAHARVSTPPLVTIVTPSFNQGAFLRQTIESVLAQDYPHIDYRVMDGGSTDDTVAILKSYGDRVQWVSEPDRGQTHAINKGMAQARGEVRAYLNSDDLLRPGAVARVVRHFQERPGCDLVYGRDAMIDVRGRYLKTYPTADYSFERLVQECCISQPAAFWRTRLADSVGPFDESLHLVMDYDYWMRADRAGGVLEHIPDVLAHTRVHRDAKSSGAGKIEAYRRKFFDELWNISLRHAGYVSSHYIHLWLYTAVFNRYRWARGHEDILNHLCQKWHHYRFRCGWGWRPTAWTMFREEWWRVTRRLLRPVRLLDPRRWPRSAPAPVKLETDLWLGPELTLPDAASPVRLAGVPARAATLRVYRGETEVAAVTLEAETPADLSIDAPGTGPIRITFSDSELLPDGRRVSFKLLGTTLFTERDAA